MADREKLSEKRTHHRARLIKTHEGTFLNVEDCRRALKDPGFVKECLAVMKVGIESGRPHLEAFQRALGNVIYELSGEPDRNE